MNNNEISNRFVKVRRAALADIPELLVLLESLYELEVDYQFERDKQARGLELLADADNACVFVAEYEGEVVGMCSVQTVISTVQGTPSGWVEDVVVLDKFRGCGIGSKLLQAIDEWARENDVSRLQLLADDKNDKAIGFYHKHQWQTMHALALRKYP